MNEPSNGIEVLWECDQCTYQEWRPPDQEPWLCPVCGWERWSAVQTRPLGGGQPEDPDGSGGAGA